MTINATVSMTLKNSVSDINSLLSLDKQFLEFHPM